jgi:hypothetical protein
VIGVRRTEAACGRVRRAPIPGTSMMDGEK